MNVRYDMVAVYVIRPTADGRSQEFLQLRRAAGDYMGGTWQIVRGTANAGELAWQAALRELSEETGLRPAEFYRLGLMETFYLPHGETVWHVPNFVAVVSREAEVALNEEHDAHRWLPRDQMEGQMMWASERPVVAEVLREICDNGPAKPYLLMSHRNAD